MITKPINRSINQSSIHTERVGRDVHTTVVDARRQFQFRVVVFGRHLVSDVIEGRRDHVTTASDRNSHAVPSTANETTKTAMSSLCSLACKAGIFNTSLCLHPRPTQPSIPPGSVNEYQLRLGRQTQVWFIPLADERGVCR